MIKLVMVGVSALFVSHLGNQALEVVLLPSISFEAATARHDDAPAKDRLALPSLASVSRLTGLPATETAITDAAAATRQRRSSNDLLGTLVATDQQWSIASIRDQGRARTVREGDALWGATIVSIDRQRIELDDGNEIVIGRGAASSSTTSTAPSSSPCHFATPHS